MLLFSSLFSYVCRSFVIYFAMLVVISPWVSLCSLFRSLVISLCIDVFMYVFRQFCLSRLCYVLRYVFLHVFMFVCSLFMSFVLCVVS